MQLERATLEAEVWLGMHAVVEEDGKGVVHEIVGEAEVKEDHLGRGRETFAFELDPLLVRAVAGHAQVQDVEAGHERAQLGRHRGPVVHVEAEGDRVTQRDEPRPRAIRRRSHATAVRVDGDVSRRNGQRGARPQLPAIGLGIRVEARHELGGRRARARRRPPPAKRALRDDGQGEGEQRGRRRQEQLAAPGSSAGQAQPPDSAASASRPGGVASSRSSR
jgi:hypothetical protein